MEENFSKYLRLFGTLFLTLLGFIIVFALVLIGLRLFFGLLSYIPWITNLYMLLILVVPAVVFITAYLIYFRRTRLHRSKMVRAITYVLISIALLAWVAFLAWDISIFIQHVYLEIGRYHSYNMIFLGSNVACFFLIGVMQAFTTEKEKDWMQKQELE